LARRNQQNAREMYGDIGAVFGNSRHVIASHLAQ
jgi:hypothetical protein